MLLCFQHSKVGGNNETERLALLEIKAQIRDDPLGIMTSWNDTRHFCKWHGVTCSRKYEQVTKLNLKSAHLTGNLPSDLGITLPRLTFLSLSYNQFTSHIPASISNCSNLETLQLHNNNLRGQVPSLNKLVRLTHLVLSHNNLGYNQPEDFNFVSSLANSTNLQLLEIDQNNFYGAFPQVICNFTLLTYLFLNDNHIYGEIPMCIENLLKLQIFSVYDNNLSGVIPQNITKLQNLYILYLHNNHLTGVIPPSIGNLTRLSACYLANNRIQGQIPSSLGNCTSLTSLYLANNNLTGKIPVELFNLPSLSVQVDLSKNKLVGSLPDEVRQLTNLQTLLLSSNMLSGEIPNSISSCVALEYLYLAKNKFHGAIPDALHSLKGLVELDLSYNNLSGPIPQFLESLQLRLLNISHNKLEGKVPIGGVFSNATNVLVDNNSRICGGIPELKLPRCSVSQNSQKRSSVQRKKLTVAILSAFFGVIFLLASLVFVYIFCKRKRIQEPTPFNGTENFPNLSYQTLFQATNGFSAENLIGSGTFGVVYKGILKTDGSTVAIKIFNLEYRGASKSFIAECEVLRNIRHRNLLKVITACSSVDHQGRDFKALVYEYMVNGSLENWLHLSQAIDKVESTYKTSRTLDFHERLDIAVDVALSLDYLHRQCGAPIVHCDLKPSNILLDDDLVAHVGDFGLAKILLEGINSSHANQYSSVGVRGTIGYTPPEYGLGNEVITNGDVYSFGILLLEMFTGMRPTDDMFKGSLSLHNFVKNAIPEEIDTIVDHTLIEDIDKEKDTNKSVMLEALTSVLVVALSCSAEVPQERLDMSDVVANLSLIRNKLLD
uniref:non-specific serine/threonine protein kinase n=1 Tax=Chenopodium quinoa TaxID=63459 RepID=A0A803MKC1_CHEQI